MRKGVRKAIREGEKPETKMTQAEERQFLVKLIRHELREYTLYLVV